MRFLPLQEFTTLQKVLIKELQNPEWEWRSRDALVSAVEKKREELENEICIMPYQVMDRKESAFSAIRSLHSHGIIETMTATIEENDIIASKLYYRLKL
jgi:hypothetical protein